MLLIELNINFILFTKKELYSLALKHKSFNSTNIILIHHNKILKNDNSSFDEIANGDIIWVIENVLYPEDSYYLSLQKKYNGTEFINILVKYDSGEVNSFNLSTEILIKDLIRAIGERKGYALNDCAFLYNANKLDLNDIRKIKDVLVPFNPTTISCLLNNNLPADGAHLGKILFGNGKRRFKIGSLEPIANIFNQGIGRKIIIGKVELTYRSENYLSFYGINKDFNYILKEE